ESILLLLVAFTLFRPGFFWDRIFPPYHTRPGIELSEVAKGMAPGEMLRIKIKCEDFNGNEYDKTLMFTMGPWKNPGERLRDIGFAVRQQGENVVVDNVVFGSIAEKMGMDFDQEIMEINLVADRLPKQIMFLPALGVLGMIYLMQKRRGGKVISSRRLRVRT
ncbi:MAG: DUF3394 domain-containing protein, partial [Desulfovibrionales bacterium]|nr:DUF3394 domain-containing protein [Desulfovibrionales bacterium]